MSYKIGNTVVIDNNAALGSVDGNSLNLTNNANISGGGSASLYTTTTPGATAAVGSNVTLAFVVGAGGAAGLQAPVVTRSNASRRFCSGGSGGATQIIGFDSSSTPSLDVTIGAAGTITSSTTGNPGGASSIESPNVHHIAGTGGKGNTISPGGPNLNTTNNPIAAYTGVYTFENSPTGKTYSTNANAPGTSWGRQTDYGGNTVFNTGIAGSPSAIVASVNSTPLINPTRTNFYGRGGSSMFSSANNQSGDPTYVPGNNFGFGQGGVSFDSSSLYLNTPGNMSYPNLEVDSNVAATPGCVLLLGF